MTVISSEQSFPQGRYASSNSKKRGVNTDKRYICNLSELNFTATIVQGLEFELPMLESGVRQV